MKKIFFKILFILIFLFLISTLTTYFILLIPPVQKKATEIICNIISEYISGKICVENLSTNLWTNIEVKRIRIKSKEDSADSIYIEKIKINYRLFKLIFFKTFEISSAEIKKIDAFFYISPDGKIKLPVLPQTINKRKNTQREKLNLKVSKIKISHLNCLFIDSVLNQYAYVNNALVKGRIYSLDSIEASIEIKNGNYQSNWWNGNIKKLEGSTLITPSYIKILSLQINSNKGDLNGKGIIPFKKYLPWEIELNTKIEVSSLPLLYKSMKHLDTCGTIFLRGTLKGLFEKPRIKLNLNANNLNYYSLLFDSLNITTLYDSTGLFLGNGIINSEAGDISFKIKSNIDNLFDSPKIGNYSGKIDLQKIKMSVLKKAFKIVPSYLDSTILACEINLAGKDLKELPSFFKSTGIISNEKLLLYPIEFFLNLDQRLWNLEITNGNNKLSGNGKFDGKEKLSGNILFSLLDPSVLKIKELEKIKGNVISLINIDGTLKKPSFLVLLRGNKIEWKGSTVDTLIAKVNIKDKKFQLDTLSTQGILNIDTLSTLYGIPPITSECRFNIIGKGELFSPVLNIKTTTKKLSYKNFIFDSSYLSFDIRQLDTVFIHKCLLWKKESKTGLNLSGSLSLKNYFTAKITGDLFIDSIEKITGNFSINGKIKKDSFEVKIKTSDIEIPSVLSLLSIDKKIEGKISIIADFGGSIKNPAGEIYLHTKDIKYNKFILFSGTFKGELKDSNTLLITEIFPYGSKNSLIIEGKAAFLPSAKWKINENSETPFSLKVKGKEIKLDSLLTVIDSSLKINALLSLEIEMLSETTKKIPSLAGTIKIDNCKVKDYKRKINISQLNASAFISGSANDPQVDYSIISGQVELFSGRLEKTELYGNISLNGLSISRGDIGLSKDGKILFTTSLPFKKANNKIEPNLDSLNITFFIEKLPFSLLNQFIESEIIKEGILNGNGIISKENEKIVLNGDLELIDGKIGLENIYPQIGPVNGKIKMRNDSIIIEQISSVWGKGSLHSDGIISLQNIKSPYIGINVNGKILEINLSNFLILGMDTISFYFTNDKEVRDEYLLSGNIEVGKCNYSQEIQITDLISNLNKPEILQEEKKKENLLNKIKLNISINMNENIEIKTNLGYLRIDGSVILGGTIKKPSFTGEILTIEGYVWYLDRKFTIEQAKLINFSSNRIDPVIDLVASTDIVALKGDQTESYTIILTVKGDLKNPVIKLSESNNELNEFEILSLLTFGQLPRGISSDTKERFRTFLGQSLIGFGTRKLEKILNIDKITLEGDIFGGRESIGHTRITLARRVSPRLTLIYESEIGNLTKPKISALYRLTNNIFISGERTSEGKSGIDIILKYSR